MNRCTNTPGDKSPGGTLINDDKMLKWKIIDSEGILDRNLWVVHRYIYLHTYFPQNNLKASRAELLFDTTVHTLAIVYHNILFFVIYHIIQLIIISFQRANE